MTYAAVATDNGYIFCGGKPEAMPPAKKKKLVRKAVAPTLKSADVIPSKDFVPSFMSSKISALRASLISMKECLLRDPFSKIRDFSVNDCPRKIHAKNEKRRNRRIKEMNKDAYCFS